MDSSYPAVFIRMIRNESRNKSSTDDRITIKRVDNNMEVKYYDSQTKKASTILLTQTGLVAYMKTLIDSIANDDDPFKAIQLGFPGYPVIYYAPEKLKLYSVKKSIEVMASTVQDSWFADSYWWGGEDYHNEGNEMEDECCKWEACPIKTPKNTHEFYYDY